MQVANVSLYDENDNCVIYGVPLMFVPQPGNLLMLEGVIWEVTSQPMINIGNRTLAMNAEDPMPVAVRVRLGQGIHDPYPGPGDPR